MHSMCKLRRLHSVLSNTERMKTSSIHSLDLRRVRKVTYLYWRLILCLTLCYLFIKKNLSETYTQDFFRGLIYQGHPQVEKDKFTVSFTNNQALTVLIQKLKFSKALDIRGQFRTLN